MKNLSEQILKFKKLTGLINEENTINIHPLLPYEGDMLYEGRFGNSIRFGSTVKNSSIPNPWSTGSANKN
jgi:hypothetical protein